MSTRVSIVRVSILSSLVSCAATSCVRLDEGHCIVNGGDFACNDDERMCATEIEGFREPSDPGDGCVSIAETKRYFPEFLVHVKYGLPDSLWPHGEANDDVDSVIGTLAQASEERALECELDDGRVQELDLLWREARAVRTYLERRDRVSVESMTLQPLQVKAIEAFNAGVDGWLEECKQ